MGTCFWYLGLPFVLEASIIKDVTLSFQWRKVPFQNYQDYL